MINRWVGVGRLVADPQVFDTKGGSKIANFTIAVSRGVKKDDKDVTDFIPCFVGGKQAEYMEKYIKKGYLVAIDGKIQVDNYTDKNGNKKQSFKVCAMQLQNLQGKEQKQEYYSSNVDTSSYNQTAGVDDTNNPYSNAGEDYTGALDIDADSLPF